jgi:purine-nucleoside phosphorylase
MNDNDLQETLKFIRDKTHRAPKLGFVLGSGLGQFAESVKNPVKIPFSQLPHFATASVEGHSGYLVLGTLEGKEVAILQGRLHAYEGYDFEQVIYPVRTLASLGVQDLVVTNAAGGLKRTMRPGDFMVLKDHINLTGANPLRGPNWKGGPRFLDMTEPYDKKMRELIKSCLKREKARVSEGIYVGVMGPTYETAAEISFYAKIGGSAVGMSTVADVIAARHAGLRVVGLSCITNLGTGLSRSKLSHEDVKKVAQRVEKTFTNALLSFTKKL